MKKILVMGVSAGVGKSTFARELSDMLSIQVCHLDSIYWKPGWIEAPIEEFSKKQQKFMDNNHQWIMEGNYSSTYDVRAVQADTIIYLELPLSTCLYRVIKRWWKYRGRTRLDMAEGCPEKLDREFLWFILTTYHRRKRKMLDRFKEFEQLHPRNKVHILKSRKDLKLFLNHVQCRSSND